MARKLDTSNTGLFRRALDRAAGGAGANSALFGLSTQMRYREIALDRIEPNPDQPRRDAAGADIDALAHSIADRGLLQPINVLEVAPDRFRIIAGERRFRAFLALERATIPALVVETDDAQALALIENVQRVDLHPIELAMALNRLIVEKGLIQEQAAALIGKSQEYVARLLGILRLPSVILEEAPGLPSVSVSVLMELAELGDEETQLALWRRAGDGLTVKAVREAKQVRRASPSGLPSSGLPSYDPLLRTLRTNLVRVRGLRDDGAPLSPDHRVELRALRDEIDRLLAMAESD